MRRLDCWVLSLVSVSWPPVRVILTYFILRHRLDDVEVEGLVPIVNSSLESLSLETSHLAALAQVCGGLFASTKGQSVVFFWVPLVNFALFWWLHLQFWAFKCGELIQWHGGLSVNFVCEGALLVAQSHYWGVVFDLERIFGSCRPNQLSCVVLGESFWVGKSLMREGRLLGGIMSLRLDYWDVIKWVFKVVRLNI